ncbi:MAG: ATP-binding protein [bacterium]
MLISFTVENWMSYNEPATLSMVASRERQHGERVPSLPKYKLKVLPVAAIFGGNASGKTNLFKALQFAKERVVAGSQPDSLIPVAPFRLNPVNASNPCRFVFEILINEVIYEYSFSVTRTEVIEEKLVEILKSSELVHFHRIDGEANLAKIYDGDQFLKYAFKGTRENQLFITNTVMQKIEVFDPVYNWFQKTLQLVGPDARFRPIERFFQEDDPLNPAMSAALGNLDTGINRIGKVQVSFESIPLLERLIPRLQELLQEGKTFTITSDTNKERYIVTREDGELKAYVLVSYHNGADGNDIRFDMQEESDGSQRVIDLLPAFIDMGTQSSSKVYVIDELDRSLHTELTRKLLENYLDCCTSNTRSQLLFTTHDVMLMDQDKLRRDEIWVTERDSTGGSILRSFSDYKEVRYDKDIRKSYLQGRLGGTPRIMSDIMAGCSK